MDKRDKLEKYIKEQVETIQFKEEDRMWADFLAKNAVQKKKIGFLPWIILGCAIGVGAYWALQKYNSIQTDTEVTQQQIIDNTNDAITQSNKNLSKETIINDITTKQPTEIIIEKGANEDIENPLTNTPTILPKSQSTKSNIKPSNAKSNNINNISKTQKINIEKPTPNYAKSKQEDDLMVKKTILNTQHLKLQKDTKIQLIADLKTLNIDHIDYLYSTNIEIPKITVDQAKSKWHSWFVEYRTARSTLGNNEHSLGLGYQYLVSENAGFDIRSGLSFTNGYIFSTDTLTIIRNISIVEIRKKTDLNYLTDAYLSGAYTYKYKNIHLAIGGRLRYGIYNKYDIQQSQKIKHNNFFNFSNGNSTEYSLANDWQLLQRWRVETFGEITYAFPNFQLGITVSKQLNALEKNNIDATDFLNVPVRFGLQLKYNLTNDSIIYNN